MTIRRVILFVTFLTLMYNSFAHMTKETPAIKAKPKMLLNKEVFVSQSNDNGKSDFARDEQKKSTTLSRATQLNLAYHMNRNSSVCSCEQ